MADENRNENFLDKYNERLTLGPVELREIWRHYDTDDSGYLERGPELDRFLADLLGVDGTQASEQEVEDFKDGVFEMFDVNADGKLDFAELEQLFNG